MDRSQIDRSRRRPRARSRRVWHDAAHGPCTVAVAVATLTSPWGPVLVAATSRGVAAVDLGASRACCGGCSLTGSADRPPWSSARRAGKPRTRGSGGGARRAPRGRSGRPRRVPLDWTGIKAWDRRVLEGARTVGPGEVTSYGRLARRIGAPGAARAVGAALGRNPFWLFVPCHRVVAGDGSLGGYGDEPDALEIKRDLLAREGIALPITRLVD